MPSIGALIGSPVSSEDVSNLQIWAWQRPRASVRPSVPKLRQQLVGAVGVADQFGGNMGVLRGCAQLGMPQQNLNNADIRPGFKKMGRKAVAERMQCAARLLNPRQVFGCTESAIQLAR